jgi:hypothetical protein
MDNICLKETDNFIKELIYKNKIIIFGKIDCDFTNKALKHFKDNYNYDPIIFNLDNNNNINIIKNTNKNNINENVLRNNIENKNLINNNNNKDFILCLKKRTKTNITPMIYLNGMFLGNYKDLENKTFLKELDIFF